MNKIILFAVIISINVAIFSITETAIAETQPLPQKPACSFEGEIVETGKSGIVGFIGLTVKVDTVIKTTQIGDEIIMKNFVGCNYYKGKVISGYILGQEKYPKNYLAPGLKFNGEFYALSGYAGSQTLDRENAFFNIKPLTETKDILPEYPKSDLIEGRTYAVKEWNANTSDNYSVEEVLSFDRLKYRGASSIAVKPYIVRGYLVSRELADCPPCLNSEPGLCAPCRLGQIVIASSQLDSAKTLRVSVSSDAKAQDLRRKIQELRLNDFYGFILQPGQNYPELVTLEVNQPAKKSLFARFINWLLGIFEK